ncbi:MAG TPA: DUF2249 domain-containing protein [Xanthomonadaceae bacterium]|nr:DUF2249 domain-containing protein [Xanthomonadaceae bacterium]
MNAFDWPDLAAGIGVLESLDAAGADCRVVAGEAPRGVDPAMPAANADGPVLDLRGLAAPEPLLRALEAADTLAPGESLELLTPLLPTPLLQALGERGFIARARVLADGSARVRVRLP